MTLFCPLNQPQCKRSIMTAGGPFEKKECPLSKNKKCFFAPSACPAVPQQGDKCYWTQIKGVIEQGGCKVKANPLSQLAGRCCRVQKAQLQNPGQKSYPPANCAELPPCVRCHIGHPNEKEGDDKSKKRAKKKKESFNTAIPFKNEDSKQTSSPRRARSRSRRLKNNRLSEIGKNGTTKRKVGRGISCFKPEEAMVRISPERTKTKKDIKVEDVKVQKSARHRSKKSKVAEHQPKQTVPEKREEIFRKAVYDKVDMLQDREYLLVPQCSSASRQIMPCTACLIDLLGTPGQNSGTTRTSGTGDDTEERCRVQRILNTCTAFRVPSVCPNGCPCTDVPLLEDEEDDGDCPFLQHPPSSSPSPGCPLSRLPDLPLILDHGRVPYRGAAYDPCMCPIIPGNCCYTLPGCPVHTIRALVDCPTLNRNI